jgi:(p)ppGpp synthase/HD superfamily hydrolase
MSLTPAGHLNLAEIPVERLSRFKSLRTDGTGTEDRFRRQIAEQGLDTAVVLAALEFASQLDYRHPGMSKASYLAHPLRVAGMAAQLASPNEEGLIVVALLHNVFEVTAVTSEEISKRFGHDISGIISILTVDRKLQPLREYRQSYYAEILRSRAATRIKVLDKLDNMFVLCLNPDEQVRHDYLLEIEEFVLPLVEHHVPALELYFRELLADCRSLGHLPLDSLQAAQYESRHCD